MNYNDPLPLTSNVTKLVPKSKTHEGPRIDGSVLVPRPTEEYLSVNWLEYDVDTDINICLKKIVDIYKQKLNVKKSHFLPVINVQKAIEKIETTTQDNRIIQILYKPELKPEYEHNDPSHSGIHGYSNKDIVIGELMADIVEEIYKAEFFLENFDI